MLGYPESKATLVSWVRIFDEEEAKITKLPRYTDEQIDRAIPKLTPTAEFESNYIALDTLLPKLLRKPIHYPVIPTLVFTLPRVGQVGVSVDEAKKDSRYRVEAVEIGKTMSWANKNDPEEKLNFVFNQKNELVGAAAYSDQEGEYLDLLTIIINQKLKAKDLSKMIFSFPTTTYGLMSSLIPAMIKR